METKQTSTMENFKFTKGEWEVFKPDHIGCTNVRIGKNNGFCQFVELWHHQNSKEESEANAKLIAAAPKLLDALIELEQRVVMIMSQLVDSPHEISNDITIQKVRNAINKATK